MFYYKQTHKNKYFQILCFLKSAKQRQSQWLCSMWSAVCLSHLTLQGIRSLGCLHLHVIRQWRVLMQHEPVVLITDQWLGLFSVGDLHHVHGEVVLPELLRRVLPILNLEMEGSTEKRNESVCSLIDCFSEYTVCWVMVKKYLRRSVACWRGPSERCLCHPAVPSARSSSLWSSQILLCTFAEMTNQETFNFNFSFCSRISNMRVLCCVKR